ncbi:hypothetical protein GCM10007418_06630 [Halopseudomonas salina]|uniref:Uncharacterized protein n=1 Tax=Halopseudomonas salina TaxID=1323744 RepID=A0ABQ1P617_9GAMM|nr:hypothetical protein GCM10007418_06630 [Halopseudomonas salina]
MDGIELEAPPPPPGKHPASTAPAESSTATRIDAESLFIRIVIS